MTKKIINVSPAVSGKNIGLVGVGKMGTGIGKNLLSQGAFLRVKGKKNREGIDFLLRRGAKEYFSVISLAKVSDIVILSLPSSTEVEEVCLRDGLFETLARGSIIIDCTTSRPSSTILLKEKAEKRGVCFVDAPVTRTPIEAAEGNLIALLGAPDNDVYHHARILASFCETIVHAGSVGNGHKLKLLNNALTMSVTAAMIEMCRIAYELNLDLSLVREVIGRGGGNCGISSAIFSYILNKNNDELAFSVQNAVKDLSYLSEITRISNPVIENVYKKFLYALSQGKDRDNITCLLNFDSFFLKSRDHSNSVSIYVSQK